MRERWYRYDVLKCICAFLVVCIHAPFPGIFGEYVTAISRIAVPVFFMISGYYYSFDLRIRKRQIVKILWMTITANIFYFIFYFLYNCLRGNIVDYLNSVFTLKNMLYFIFFNNSPFSGHLWYLGGILYVIAIAYFLKEEKTFMIFYILTPILILLDLVFGKYSLLIWGKEFSYIYLRNWIIVGIPYFTIGHLLKKYENKIAGIRLNPFKKIILVFLLTLLNVLERYMLVVLNVNANRDQYLSTTLFAIIAFVICMTNLSEKSPSGIEKCAAMIGEKYSTEIYIFHPAVLFVINIIVTRVSFLRIVIYSYPVIIFGITLFAILMARRIERKWCDVLKC